VSVVAARLYRSGKNIKAVSLVEPIDCKGKSEFVWIGLFEPSERELEQLQLISVRAASGAKLPLTGMSVLALPAQRCTQTGVKSLCWGFKLQVSRFFPKASAKSVAEFETVACLRPGFAVAAERPAVHDWKFATRVEWLNGH
jgi:hypothetical protein